MAHRFRGPNGAIFSLGDPVPAFVQKWIARGEVEELEPDPAAAPEQPPKHGAGSGRNAWAAYAARVGVPVSDDMGRAEIIAAVEENAE